MSSGRRCRPSRSCSPAHRRCTRCRGTRRSRCRARRPRSLALRTQQIVAYESGVTRTVDPLGGSYYLESLTDELEERAVTLLDEIEAERRGRGDRGRLARARDRRRRVPPAARRSSPATGSSSGVNRFRNEDADEQDVELLSVPERGPGSPARAARAASRRTGRAGGGDRARGCRGAPRRARENTDAGDPRRRARLRHGRRDLTALGDVFGYHRASTVVVMRRHARLRRARPRRHRSRECRASARRRCSGARSSPEADAERRRGRAVRPRLALELVAPARHGDSDRPVSRETRPRPSSRRAARWTNRSTGSSLDVRAEGIDVVGGDRAVLRWSAVPLPAPLVHRRRPRRAGRGRTPSVTGYPLENVRVVDLTQYVAGPVLHPGPGRPRSGHRQGRASRERGRLPRAGPRVRERRERELSDAEPGQAIARAGLRDGGRSRPARGVARRGRRPGREHAPGALAKHGLDYESLSERHPHLVYCSISAFGQRGRAQTKGLRPHDPGPVGAHGATGHAGQRPAKIPVAALDFGSALYGVVGILAALAQRERTGRGQWVQTSLLEMRACLALDARRHLPPGW